jgi:hypothetical protein
VRPDGGRIEIGVAAGVCNRLEVLVQEDDEEDVAALDQVLPDVRQFDPPPVGHRLLRRQRQCGGKLARLLAHQIRQIRPSLPREHPARRPEAHPQQQDKADDELPLQPEPL